MKPLADLLPGVVADLATRHHLNGAPPMTEQPHDRMHGPVHLWFELSYSSYQVLPRVLMQSMPLEWQERMVACLTEIREAFQHVEQPESYEVKPCRWAAPEDMPRDQLAKYGVDVIADPHEDDDVQWYYDGDEIEPWQRVVPIPVEDPLPHYRRGYVEPAERGAA